MGHSLLNPFHRLANNRSLRRVLFVLRRPLSLLCLLVILPWLKPEYFFIGLAVSVLGEALQVWSFASLDKQKELAANGPYAVVRNPMYIGRYFLIVGVALMSGNPVIVGVVTVGYYFYVVNRVKREEVTLTEILGEPYENYCATVNRFWPSLRGTKLADLCYFRWRLFAQNNAHWNLLGALVGWAGLYYYTLVR